MTADTIRSYVRTNLFTNDELQIDEANYSNMRTLEQQNKEGYTQIYADMSSPLQAGGKIHLCNVCV